QPACGRTRTLGSMDDPRWEPGMPVLDRQPVGPGSAAQTAGTLPPRSVPETAPTPLQKHYVNLSAVGLVCGAIAITALELGTPPRLDGTNAQLLHAVRRVAEFRPDRRRGPAPARLRRLRLHRVRQPATRRHDDPGDRGRRGDPDPARHRARLWPVGAAGRLP